MVALLKQANVTRFKDSDSVVDLLPGFCSWQIDVGANGYARGHVDLTALDSEEPSRLRPLFTNRLGAQSTALFWLYKSKIYLTQDRDLTASDVRAQINEVSNTRRLRLEKAHALQAMTLELDKRSVRTPLPQDVKVLVWQRDQGRCTECFSQASLEFDHIIPIALGGSNSVRNIQLLCESCNRRKGATLG